MIPDRQAIKPSMLERHFQTAIQIILVALLLWAGSELVKIGQQSMVLEERLAGQGAMLNEMRRELKEWGDLYWRRSEAQRELDTIERRLDQLDGRVTSLERE